VHSLEEYCSQPRSLQHTCSQPRSVPAYQHTSVPAPTVRAVTGLNHYAEDNAEVNIVCSFFRKPHRPPEMSVAFTNLYAALVKTLQSGVLFFAMTQRISPAAVKANRPCPSIRTTATCNRSTSAASSLPTVVIMNVTQGGGQYVTGLHDDDYTRRDDVEKGSVGKLTIRPHDIRPEDTLIVSAYAGCRRRDRHDVGHRLKSNAEHRTDARRCTKLKGTPTIV
jgi:hypothetical protein